MINNPSIKFAAAVFTAAGMLCISNAAGAAEYVISEKNKKFSEKKLAVAMGDTVKVVNDDKVKHNVIIKELSYNSGLQEIGASSTITFDKAGKFTVRCGIHPKMKLKVTVN